MTSRRKAIAAAVVGSVFTLAAMPTSAQDPQIVGWTATQVLDAFGSASSTATAGGGGETWYYDHTTVGTVKILFVSARVVDIEPAGAVDALRQPRPTTFYQPVASAKLSRPLNSVRGNARRAVGFLTTLGGAVMMAAAFTWDGGQYCEGRNAHLIDYEDVYANIPDVCVSTVGSRTTIGSPRSWVDTELVRPRLLWAGGITAAAGLVLTFLPVRHDKFVDSLTVTPDGVHASKTFTFGK
jgi:hypothetical protein